MSSALVPRLVLLPHPPGGQSQAFLATLVRALNFNATRVTRTCYQIDPLLYPSLFVKETRSQGLTLRPWPPQYVALAHQGTLTVPTEVEAAKPAQFCWYFYTILGEERLLLNRKDSSQTGLKETQNNGP